jgi:hypothetical protein
MRQAPEVGFEATRRTRGLGQQQPVASGGSPLTRSAVAAGLAAPANRLLLQANTPCMYAALANRQAFPAAGECAAIMTSDLFNPAFG